MNDSILEDSSLNEKVCNVCDQKYPITDFRKCYGKDKQFWRSKKCKHCANVESRKQYSEKHPKRITIAIPEGYKKCGKCKETKQNFEFNKDKNRKSGLSSLCRSCAIARNKDYVKRNPGKSTSRAKRWRLKNPEKTKANAKKYYYANPERVHKRSADYYRKNKEKCLNKAKSWREANPEKVREYRLRYRMHIRNNTPENVNEAFLNYIQALLKSKCTYCENQATTIDHIIPISKGGLNEPSNLVGACVNCNSSKRDKNLQQFASVISCSDFE